MKEKGKLVCAYCGRDDLKLISKITKEIATVDHVIPKSKGGAIYSLDNLVIACHNCNSNKSDKLLEKPCHENSLHLS